MNNLIKLSLILLFSLFINSCKKPDCDSSENFRINDVAVNSAANAFNVSETLNFSHERESGRKIKIEWNFGDGTLGDGSPIQHAYAEKGIYFVEMQISGDGMFNSCAVILGDSIIIE